MIDLLEREVKVDDYVVFRRKDCQELIIGKISHLTPKGAKVEYKDLQSRVRLLSQIYDKHCMIINEHDMPRVKMLMLKDAHRVAK